MEKARALSRRWWLMATGAMALSGLFALLLVAGRLPGFGTVITDPLFFKRCLVVHVNLALGLWLLAFLAAMIQLLPSGGMARAGDGMAERVSGCESARGAGHAGAGKPKRVSYRGHAGDAKFAAAGTNRTLAPAWQGLAVLGLVLLSVSALVPGADPVLSNYIPVLDHPLFLAGLGALGLAFGGHFLERLWAGRRLLFPDADLSAQPPATAAAFPLLAGAAAAYLLAMGALLAAWTSVDRALPPASYYEFLFWGPGHLLQAAHALGTMAAWVWLVTELTGRPPLGRAASLALSALVVLPLFAGPFLALAGPSSPWYFRGFTELMRYGIFPAALILLGLCARALIVSRSRLRDTGPGRAACLAGFCASGGLTLAGFVLGALIRGSNTMVPAHYHASVGGVTVAYMAAAYLLARFCRMHCLPARARRLMAWQPWIYAGGQLAFAVGFAFAGYHGAARKSYGGEQVLDSLPQTLGLIVMGLGGLVAAAGGLLFLWLAHGLWRFASTDGNQAPPRVRGFASSQRDRTYPMPRARVQNHHHSEEDDLWTRKNRICNA